MACVACWAAIAWGDDPVFTYNSKTGDIDLDTMSNSVWAFTISYQVNGGVPIEHYEDNLNEHWVYLQMTESMQFYDGSIESGGVPLYPFNGTAVVAWVETNLGASDFESPNPEDPAGINVSLTDGSSIWMDMTIFAPGPGDVNSDGDVDATDFTTAAGNWAPFATTMRWQEGDVDEDGAVGNTDLGVILGNWSASASASGSFSEHLPEPTSLIFMAIGGLGLLARRRR
jgi:hypothetical protein